MHVRNDSKISKSFSVSLRSEHKIQRDSFVSTGKEKMPFFVSVHFELNTDFVHFGVFETKIEFSDAER